MTNGPRSSTEISRFAKRASAVFVVFASVGALVKTAGAPTWTAIVFAAFGVIAGVVALLLLERQQSAEALEGREVLWRESPAPIKVLQEGDGFYRLGVEYEARDALDASGQQGEAHAPYIERDVDAPLLRPAIRRAVARDERGRVQRQDWPG